MIIQLGALFLSWTDFRYLRETEYSLAGQFGQHEFLRQKVASDG